MTLTNSLIVFLFYFISEMLYVKFVVYLKDDSGNAAKAANCSATITTLMTLGIMKCIDSPWYLIPMIIGAWTGAYFTAKNKTI